MIRVVHLLAVAIVIFASFGLYRVKYEAGEQAHDVARLNSAISREKDALAVLKAEWSHLNRPARLQDLSEKYLDLQETDVKHIVTMQDLPNRPAEPDPYGTTATIR